MIPGVVILTGRRTARALPWLRLLGLLPISLLVGHEAVFAAQFGIGSAFGDAMTAGGHDGYWSAFSLVILAITSGLLGREALRAAQLRWRLRGASPAGARMTTRATSGSSARSRDVRPWRREFRGIWPALFAVTAIGFAIQENLEHIAAGQAPHGIGSLIGAEHPLAVPVLALVSALVAAAGALIRWRVRILEYRVARVAAASRRQRHLRSMAPAREWPPVGALRGHAWFLVRLLAGRAPPVVA